MPLPPPTGTVGRGIRAEVGAAGDPTPADGFEELAEVVLVAPVGPAKCRHPAVLTAERGVERDLRVAGEPVVAQLSLSADTVAEFLFP